MPDNGSKIEPVNTPPNFNAIMVAAAVFLLVGLLTMLGWFWYAGHHSISATSHSGPTGVGGMTAGDKGGKKH